MKKKRYDQKGQLINSNAGYDEMSERLETESKYDNPINLKLLLYMVAVGVCTGLLINFQSCN